MNKQLYLIDYENAHWCGGQLHVAVWAMSEEDAENIAECHMYGEQRELFSAEYEDDEYESEDECPYTVNRVEVLDENHECWVYFQDPSQHSFYPVIGEPL